MEGDGLGFDFALLDVDLVAAEDDGDVFADTDEVTWVRVLVRWRGEGTGWGRLRCQLGTFL